MEDTLRVYLRTCSTLLFLVLILVLMEDTLRVCWLSSYCYFCFSLNPCFNGRYSQRYIIRLLAMIPTVLILVLMEDTLRVILQLVLKQCKCCLNPCFNGRYSQRDAEVKNFDKAASLNPCFNGRYSQRVEDPKTF